MALRHAAERILIRCPNWIGDAVAATAAVRCLRHNYPEAHIALLLRPYVRPVFENAPWFDDIVEFDRAAAGVGEIVRVGKRLRRPPRYDLALLLTHSFSSALVTRLGRIERRVGHARNGRSFLLTDAVPWPAKGRDPRLIPKVRLYRSLLEYLGCEGADNHRPELFTSEKDEEMCAVALKNHGREEDRPLAALVPGASFGPSKQWPPERFAWVADRLARERRCQSVILTGPGEHSIAQHIVRTMKDTPVWFRPGEVSLGMLKAVVRRCALMICNDTGPRHVAIAYNVPTVVLMGPTDPAVTDSGFERERILRQQVPCGPCYLRHCPTDHQCMRRILPEVVYGTAAEMLDEYGTQPPIAGGGSA